MAETLSQLSVGLSQTDARLFSTFSEISVLERQEERVVRGIYGGITNLFIIGGKKRVFVQVLFRDPSQGVQKKNLGVVTVGPEEELVTRVLKGNQPEDIPGLPEAAVPVSLELSSRTIVNTEGRIKQLSHEREILACCPDDESKEMMRGKARQIEQLAVKIEQRRQEGNRTFVEAYRGQIADLQGIESDKISRIRFFLGARSNLTG